MTYTHLTMDELVMMESCCGHHRQKPEAFQPAGLFFQQSPFSPCVACNYEYLTSQIKIRKPYPLTLEVIGYGFFYIPL